MFFSYSPPCVISFNLKLAPHCSACKPCQAYAPEGKVVGSRTGLGSVIEPMAPTASISAPYVKPHLVLGRGLSQNTLTKLYCSFKIMPDPICVSMSIPAVSPGVVLTSIQSAPSVLTARAVGSRPLTSNTHKS